MMRFGSYRVVVIYKPAQYFFDTALEANEFARTASYDSGGPVIVEKSGRSGWLAVASYRILRLMPAALKEAEVL